MTSEGYSKQVEPRLLTPILSWSRLVLLWVLSTRFFDETFHNVLMKLILLEQIPVSVRIKWNLLHCQSQQIIHFLAHLFRQTLRALLYKRQ
jgi:hypothetical protein